MSDSPSSPLLPHGGYERLRSYKVAEAVYDATVVFCDRFIPKGSRTHDQMVQAARSGVRNISEGSGAAGTSRRSELKLTNVARSSLNDELLKDYRSFLTQRKLPIWPKDSDEAIRVRERLLKDEELAALPAFMATTDPEQAANTMLCVVNQAAYLLKRQLESQARQFLEQGGFTENLYASRMAHREGSPQCPSCGKPMRLRTVRNGPRAGALGLHHLSAVPGDTAD